MDVVPGSTDRINQVLAALFRAHQVETVRENDIIRFPTYPKLWADGKAFATSERTTQLDVRLGIEDGRVLIESFAGFGGNATERIDNALVAFSQASFHVLLSAFFGAPPDDHVGREEWLIGSHSRTVCLGNITTRFGLPASADQKADIGFFGEFERVIRAQASLSPGTHWIRLYHCEHQRECLANEVLLDNEPWVEVGNAMAAFPWPKRDGTYDVRLFLVIRDPE